MMQMKCKSMTIEEAKENCNGWIVHEKIDGTRSFFDGEKFVSPERETFKNERYIHIVNELKNINAVLDGEIYFPNGCVSDCIIEENWSKCRYAVFDVLNIDGNDISNLHLSRRLFHIKSMIKNMKNVELVNTFNTINEGWNFIKKHNREGLILKNPNSIYEDKRSKNWIKVKNFEETVEEIVGYEEGKLKGAFIMESGGKMSALSEDFVKQYFKMKEEGKVFAEIQFLYRTSSGKLFQPVLKRLTNKR